MAAKRPRMLTLSPKESLILELLIAQDEFYGPADSSLRRSAKLKRGTVYVTARGGWKRRATSRRGSKPHPADVGGDAPRRLYQPTAARPPRAPRRFPTAAPHLMPEFAR